MVAANVVRLERGYGLLGDRNACIGSPRQVLLAGWPTLNELGLQPGDLRENFLLDQVVESWPSGQIVQLGPEVLIRLTFLCEPCGQLNAIRSGLAKRLQGRRGMLGLVVRGGTVSQGDPVVVTGDRLPPLSDVASERFAEFVRRIPPGALVSTSDVLLALGLTRGYYRVIPRWIKQAAADLPVHRIVATDGRLLLQHLPHQARVLQSEGLLLPPDPADFRAGPDHRWTAIYFHELGLV